MTPAMGWLRHLAVYALAAGVSESGVPSGFASLGTSGGQDGFILSVGLCRRARPLPTATQPPATVRLSRAHTNHPAGTRRPRGPQHQ